MRKCFHMDNMAASAKIFHKPLVVVILGATGTGKSKLGLELGKYFNGEIISADSKQVYRGLDIITNKITKQESELVKHHMLNCVSPQDYFTVIDYRNRALPILENLLSCKTLPIIVGGTNYYIEALLWNVLIDSSKDACAELVFESDKKYSKIQNAKLHHVISKNLLENHFLSSISDKLIKNSADHCTTAESLHSHLNTTHVFDPGEMTITYEALDQVSSSILHQCLAEVDPPRADQLHPNDKRKIIRSLQIYDRSGRRHSELLEDQQRMPKGGMLGGSLRFPHVCALWIQCEEQVLNERLDKRVDEMVEKGLLQELVEFHEIYNQGHYLKYKERGYTKGIFESIGFKEFHSYLFSSKDMSSKKEFEEGVKQLKQVTKHYVKKQLQWIKYRFLRQDREAPSIYSLDGTFPEKWKSEVLTPAIQIVEAMLQDRKIPVEAHPFVERPPLFHKTNYCEACGKTFVTSNQWEIHLKSNRHHKRLKSLRKKMLQPVPDETIV